MKVLFLSYEVAPIYKFGGLGDVAFALSKALKKKDIDIRVAMPAYRGMPTPEHIPGTHVPMIYGRDSLFSAEGVVGNKKTPEARARAFAYFGKTILNTVKHTGWVPDIIHLNDWHMGFVAFWLKITTDPYYANTKVIFTIHNTSHQGNFPIKLLLEYHKTKDCGLAIEEGEVNFLKLGITNSDIVTTVSETYSKELAAGKFTFGMSELFKKKGITGILNGIDYDVWNSEKNSHLHICFDQKNVTHGKIINKLWLQRKLKLPASGAIPLISMISRLSEQKGFDIVYPTVKKLLDLPVQWIFMGQGSNNIREQLVALEKLAPGKVKMLDRFDEPLAHQVYASSDFFLIPSTFEPCGLTQMISMRYGTLPISSAVGGLADTVKHKVNGFVFKGHSADAFTHATKQALMVWTDARKLYTMRQKAMSEDFSSDKSAKEYIKLYKKILN